MSTLRTRLIRMGTLTLLASALASCDSSGVQTSASVSVGVGGYYGPGIYDPYYYGGCCRSAVIVRPPIHARPPINRPVARPLPMPARPRRR